MIHRIEIFSKILDTRAEVRKNKLLSFGLKGKIREVSLFDIYTLDKDFSKKELQKIASALTNPVSQIANIEMLITTKIHLGSGNRLLAWSHR